MRKGILLGGVLLLSAVIMIRGISRGEFDYNVDESQHAATGLYVASVIKDHPRHPVAYTSLYYAQYPALSGIIHWPPLFYLCEGAMFLVAGPTVVAARLAILPFALLACVFWFLLMAELVNEWAAACSTLLLALLPAVLLFEKAVMLEIPCLAVCIAALYFWYRYLTAERPRDLYFFAIALSVAMLVKQNSIFVPMACLVSIVALRKWSLVFSRRVLGPLAIAVVLVAPFYALQYFVHWKSVAVDLAGQGQGVSTQAGLWHSLLFYARALADQLGWPLLVLAVVGAATFHRWTRREGGVFMLAWIAGGYLTFTLISRKEPRHALYLIPPLMFFIAGPLLATWKLRSTRVLATGLAVVLVLHSVVVGWNYQRPYIDGYASLAGAVQELNRPGVIMFEAPLPANFIFFLRRADHERKFVVLRKSLRVTRIIWTSGVEYLATTVDQVRNVVDTSGVKYVVVSDEPPRFEGERSLRALLQTEPRFKLLGTFSITGNEPEWRGEHLYLYENTQSVAPSGGSLRIRMLTMGNDVVVPWDELGVTAKPTP